MAIDYSYLGQSAAIGAGSRVGRMVMSRASAEAIRMGSRLISAARYASNLLGPKVDEVPLELLGGMTLREAARNHRIMGGLLQQANFYVTITGVSPSPVDGATSLVRLLCQEVSYSPSTLSGDRQQIGSASIDRLTGAEHTDIRLTTLDDEAGTVKRWFDDLAGRAAARDGTFGLPGDYCVNVEVVHGIPDPVVKDRLDKGVEPYVYRAWMRPSEIEHTMSRRDNGYAELSMTFTEFDTFHTF